VGVVGQFLRRLREPSKAARAAEMQAAIRQMFAGRPHHCEKLLTEPAEPNTYPGAASRGARRNSDREAASQRSRTVGLIQLVALAGTLLVPMIARAGIMTVDFPTDVGPGGTISHGNGNADGLRISPSAEYALIAPGGMFGATGQGLGWDSDGPANPTYLGPTKIGTASLFIDDGGTPFSLLSATFIAQGDDDNFKMMSSKGGALDIPSNLIGTFDASFASGQPEWTDITWLTLGYFDAGEPTAGIERLVLAVDEPGTLAVFALGLVVLGYASRRRATIRLSPLRQE
jgi:hypothetical protein